MNSTRKNRELQEYYPLHLEIGYLLAFVFLILAFRLDLWGAREFEVTLQKQEAVEIADIQPAKHPARPPPPPRSPPPIEGPDEEVEEQKDLNSEASLNRDKASDGPPPQPQGQRDSEEYGRDVYIFVEEDPECGGIESVQKQVTYPPAARWAGIEGKVFVEFIVNKQGKVTNPKITRSEHSLLNEAALNAVRKLDCEPGKQRGRPVRVRMSLPVTFKLKEGS